MKNLKFMTLIILSAFALMGCTSTKNNENAVLEDQIAQLEQQVTDLEKENKTLTEEKNKTDDAAANSTTTNANYENDTLEALEDLVTKAVKLVDETKASGTDEEKRAKFLEIKNTLEEIEDRLDAYEDRYEVKYEKGEITKEATCKESGVKTYTCEACGDFYTEDIAKICMETIFIPTIKAMNAEGRTFKGCLYFGLMLTPKGPKVIEYNCRFGDPETQVVLPLLESDLLTVMQATTNGSLSETEVKFSNGNACCVIMASKGYPQSYEKGYEMTIPTSVWNNVYIAGAKLENGVLKTNGGRVLGATAIGNTLEEAITNAYQIVNEIKFDNAYFRKDIGAKALKAYKEN